YQYRTLSPFGAEQIRSGRLGAAPKLAPEVQLPGQHGVELKGIELERRNGHSAEVLLGLPLSARGGPGRHGGELSRARDRELSPGLQDPCGGDPDVVVRLQGATDERLKLLVSEHLPPLGLAERCRPRHRGRLAAIADRNVER